MAEVRLENLYKIYPGNVKAVDNVNLDIKDKEFLVLVGPSGCGKTTTLRMVAGLEDISAGEIYIGDRLVNDVPPKDRNIAMVFQNYALYPHMTVFKHMAFSLKLRHTPKYEITRRVKTAADILGIGDLLDRKPRQLSGGQRQRVAVGRAIVRQPEVFLFDEPLSNLDAKLRVQMRTEIAALHHRLGATMIYVTHDQVEAMTLGQRIVVLHEGRVQQIDSPLNLYNHPANRFVAGFIGSPAMNFLRGRVTRANGLRFMVEDAGLELRLPDWCGAVLEAHSARELMVGFRPESLHAAHGRAPGAELATLPLTVDVLEPLGNEIFVHAHAGDVRVTARVPPQPLPGPGEPIALAIDLARLHFFAADTGEVIAATPVAAA